MTEDYNLRTLILKINNRQKEGFLKVLSDSEEDDDIVQVLRKGMRKKFRNWKKKTLKGNILTRLCQWNLRE